KRDWSSDVCSSDLRIVTGDATDGWTPFTDVTATDASGWPPPLVADDDPIRLMYTSGTESRPKGAVLTSRALQAEYLSAIIDGGDDRRRRRPAHLAALPLRAARLLPRAGPCARCDEHHPARAGAGCRAGRDRRARVCKCLAPPAVGSALVRHAD